MPKRDADQASSNSSANANQQVSIRSRLTMRELDEILQTIEQTLLQRYANNRSSTPYQIEPIDANKTADRQLLTMAKKMTRSGIILKTGKNLLDMSFGMLNGCERHVHRQIDSAAARRRYLRPRSQILRLRMLYWRTAWSNVFENEGTSPRQQKTYTSCQEQYRRTKGCRVRWRVIEYVDVMGGFANCWSI